MFPPHRITGSRTVLSRTGPPHASAVASILIVLGVLALATLLPPAASAAPLGRAATGELLYYPCTSCHPLGLDGRPTGANPNDFEQHQIVLEAHDTLGEGSVACLACHDDPTRDPGRLRVVGAGFVEAGSDDVSLVCYQCHSAQYQEWQDGIHGREQSGCTAAGCHDPHTPAWIYGAPLPPFTGTGFEVRVVSNRVPFTPLAGPPAPAPVETPFWLAIASAVGVLLAVGLIGLMVRGRHAR
ncbi:MAG: hypothetical protein K0B85_00510 [Coriobacteriia bacterium]|nr:hypothetical protein [Coriobacteriia bacterium]